MTVSLTPILSNWWLGSDAPSDWRDVPLLTALSYGVASVEADVYLVNGTLYVRHFLCVLVSTHALLARLGMKSQL